MSLMGMYIYIYVYLYFDGGLSLVNEFIKNCIEMQTKVYTSNLWQSQSRVKPKNAVVHTSMHRESQNINQKKGEAFHKELCDYSEHEKTGTQGEMAQNIPQTNSKRAPFHSC